MSFQAYLTNIEKQTGKSIQVILDDAEKADILTSSLTATQWIDWTHVHYGLGRGHAMALWKYMIELGRVHVEKTTLKKRG